MELNRKIKGKMGEDIAVDYLKKHGYKIIERNYTYKTLGEIDIIALDKKRNFTVFVEVKTKDSLDYGYPEYAITPAKIRQVRKVAELYLFEKKIYEIDCRFDVITILRTNGKPPEINHYENSF